MNYISNFLLNTTPPNIEHKLNALETIGNAFLTPLSNAGGTFLIKYQEGESLLARKILAVAVIIFTLWLSVTGIVLKGIGQMLPHDLIHAKDITNENIHLASQQRVAECYDQVEILRDVFIENGFVKAGIPEFTMICGTALGAERHLGMIPWDDDVDVAVFMSETRFEELVPRLKAAGLEIIRTYRGICSFYKFKFTQEKFNELYPEADYSSSAELDLFFWAKMSDGSYTYDTKHARANWPTDYITAEEFEEGFEMKPFGDIHLPGIKAQANYTKRAYGENCLTHGLETHCHTKVCGVVIPFARFGAHYFEIEGYKNICAKKSAPAPDFRAPNLKQEPLLN